MSDIIPFDDDKNIAIYELINNLSNISSENDLLDRADEIYVKIIFLGETDQQQALKQGLINQLLDRAIVLPEGYKFNRIFASALRYDDSTDGDDRTYEIVQEYLRKHEKMFNKLSGAALSKLGYFQFKDDELYLARPIADFIYSIIESTVQWDFAEEDAERKLQRKFIELELAETLGKFCDYMDSLSEYIANEGISLSLIVSELFEIGETKEHIPKLIRLYNEEFNNCDQLELLIEALEHPLNASRYNKPSKDMEYDYMDFHGLVAQDERVRRAYKGQV